MAALLSRRKTNAIFLLSEIGAESLFNPIILYGADGWKLMVMIPLLRNFYVSGGGALTAHGTQSPFVGCLLLNLTPGGPENVEFWKSSYSGTPTRLGIYPSQGEESRSSAVSGKVTSSSEQDLGVA